MGSATAARRGGTTPEGVEIREGVRGSSLRITFRWLGKKCRETLGIPATPGNIKYASRLRAEVINAIERGTFDYAATFPSSRLAKLHAPALKKRYKIGHLVDQYINDARISLSPSTIRGYVRLNSARISPTWGDRWADEVTTPEIRQWIFVLASELSTKSVRNCVGLLSAALNRALADSLISSNPLAPIKLKSVLPRKRKGEDDDIDPFNDQEIYDILSACASVEERCLWQFAFATGLRTGELIAIRWESVDWARGLLRIKDNVVTGEFGTVEKDTKTGDVRDIPILPGAREALETMKAHSFLQHDHILIHPISRKRWRDEKQIREQSWRPTIIRSGVRYRYPYQTRHTFASRLLMAGEPELLVAKLLGHASVEMVRRHYGKYIRQTDGITMRGDYSEFGANLGPERQFKSPLNN